MCGIAGIMNLRGGPVSGLERRLEVMNALQAHRGPDGQGVWFDEPRGIGLAHRRLSVIDIEGGAQPMSDDAGNVLVFNGEIYNYLELRRELGEESFRTGSDTEVILAAWRRWGTGCLDRLRGMFAFALWAPSLGKLLLARDRFGIKPLYYTQVGDTLHFASEAKALLPFLPEVATDRESFKEYLAFQFCLGSKTLFQGVSQLMPGHLIMAGSGGVDVRRYWELYFELDWDHTSLYFEKRVQELLEESARLHVRSDVPLGVYISGGLDSSTVAVLASREAGDGLMGFTGTFSEGPEYDETTYARAVAHHAGIVLHELTIGVDDFIGNIERVIEHLDYPVAGPGAFPQYMVSGLAAKHRKVVLGGQGGDEIFGGYARYLIAYFEQCIKGAIDGSMHTGNFVVTYESIIPNLHVLRQYKPLMKHFFAEGLFEDLDKRYYRLIDRGVQLENAVRWDMLKGLPVFDTFREIFFASNVGKQSYFDLMTHFDFKTLLPALLHVEDRMSMAHGLEARVPLLDHPLVELMATIPADVKFKGGKLKRLLRKAASGLLPTGIVERKDKMGFPVPLTEWLQGPARDFVMDILSSGPALGRELVDNRFAVDCLEREGKFGRNLWGLLSFEIWQRLFHDRQAHYRSLIK